MKFLSIQYGRDLQNKIRVIDTYAMSIENVRCSKISSKDERSLKYLTMSHGVNRKLVLIEIFQI